MLDLVRYKRPEAFQATRKRQNTSRKHCRHGDNPRADSREFEFFGLRQTPMEETGLKLFVRLGRLSRVPRPKNSNPEVQIGPNRP